MKMLVLILFLALTACGAKQIEPSCAKTELSPDTSRPDILVIGDSISIGYTPHLQDLLPNYDIDHNACNAKFSANGVNHIDEWLNQRPTYEAITFNHGLWDAADWVNASDSEYRENLFIIAEKIKAKTSKPLFILTTEVLPGTEHRLDSRVVELNAIARDVMDREDIPVVDLYSVSQTIRLDHVSPNDVHYTSEGYSALAEAVAAGLKTEYDVH